MVSAVPSPALLVRGLSANHNSSDATAYLLGSADLDARIVQFQQTLQPLNNVHPSRQDLISRLLHVHILINCATIQLQKPLDVRANGMPMDSRTFMAAHAAANVLNQVNIGALTFVDSSIGFLLVSVADVLASALRLFGLDPATSMSHNPREQRIVVALSQIRYALTTWGERNAYISGFHHLCAPTLDSNPPSYRSTIAPLAKDSGNHIV
ncbi:uncharacterized protein C8Q71DRAFT_570866 [Rhodofomes roseus]|uniref:Uncharacterized protein n=1 Tax=Rhodofomes roseus TaxID=34475 RepID=A0ABQ8KKK2_9APHY|nr:uncharacterized protein C8Q71DRAFT_570866 [Rhodofomes roseus]KAH9837969.1 hypothetical protein C8Q71DRAFT_570866 [Rhodofomes roseus]